MKSLYIHVSLNFIQKQLPHLVDI